MFEKVVPGAKMHSWELVTPDDEVSGVSANSYQADEWEVWVAAAEFVRSEPLESELQDGVTQALAEVAGVTVAFSEDRETWIVKGTAGGPSLVLAAGSVVARLKDRIDQALNDFD